jgi:hypothetical protein
VTSRKRERREIPLKKKIVTKTLKKEHKDGKTNARRTIASRIKNKYEKRPQNHRNRYENCEKWNKQMEKRTHAENVLRE